MTGHQLLDLYASLFFWINVIVVGFVARFLGDGVKYLVGQTRSRASMRSESRRRKIDETRHRMTERLRNDPHAQVLYSLADIRFRIVAVAVILVGLFIVLAAVAVAVPEPVRLLLLLLGTVFLFASGSMFSAANERRLILLSAVDGIPFEAKTPPSTETLS